eukprot:scaffold5761_cov39-Tisochrysis_lutea.AAC.2
MLLGRLPCSVLPALVAVCVLQFDPMLGARADDAVAAVEAAQEPFVQALLEKTAANRERNDAVVRQKTEAAVYASIAGSAGIKRQIVGLDGKYVYLDRKEVARLTRRGELACAMDGTCRVVERRGAPLQLALPEVKQLKCDGVGRNCRFRPT